LLHRSPARRRAGVAIVLTGTLLLAACGGGGTSSSAAASGGAGLSGEILVSGSSTVEPITSIAAEDFTTANPDVSIQVEGPGTGDGFALFCDGETDISDASRAIKDEEAAACEANGVNYVELKIGIDGLSVITSTANDTVDCLSFGDLYALVGPESQGLDTWDAANELATALGTDFGALHTPYPAAALDITGPGEESGTFDSFVELVLAAPSEARGVDATTRPDYQASADDNVIIENVAGSDSSLGWVGYAFADENADAVKSLEVDGGDGCVAATPETIADGSYPIARDLFIYVNTDNAASNPALAAFVDAYLSDAGIAAVTEADYVALDAAALDETRAAWDGR
jgi:phosphate transport system substrate-binding protein